MESILGNTQAELEQVQRLLGRDIPSYRQAYSDRMAWMMACMSELAYLKFNNKDMPTLEKALGVLKLELIQKFDSNGTQAILVSNDRFMILAFRGTEKTMKDIKADMKAKTMKCETGGKIHTGFNEAFQAVSLDIQKSLKESALEDRPLLITGHSLGGALATIAAKKLSNAGGIAACYTFGSPRVGNWEWTARIKVPIYRLVNAADCVTMLPPGDVLITIISWIPQGIAWISIPFISRLAESCNRLLVSKFGGYLHSGNMRYMTNCKSGQYNNVQLLYSVTVFWRLKGWFMKNFSWKKPLSDHSINVYRKKLMIIAEKRNTIN